MVEVTENRRKSADKLVYTARTLAVLSWVFFIVALVVSYYAAPEESYGLLMNKDIEIREHWVKPLTNYLYLVLWLSAFLSAVSFILTRFRSRRKEDSRQFNLVLLIVTIIAWISYILTHSN